MKSVKGTIISQSKAASGFWYSVISAEGIYRFFSKKESFSLFENCEVMLQRKNNTFFLSDFSSLDSTPPLKARPDNIVVAFWLSSLAGSLTFYDSGELRFVEECRSAVSSDFDADLLEHIEENYLKVAGFNENEDKEDIIKDCFYGTINLRKSLINRFLSKDRR
ncbi:MAG: hypothetical protein ACOX2F_09095 [bacterium]